MRHVVKVEVRAEWQPTDTLRLYKGSENAADLAGSSPAGGVAVAEAPVRQAAVGALIEIAFDHRAADICATLPVGVTCIDAAGNESAALETTVQRKQPPQASGRPDVAATASPGEATLTWLASPDL